MFLGWNKKGSTYRDLFIIKNLVYDPCGFKCSLPQIEPEGVEYGACSFELNNLKIRFRVAKTTPKKIGQFVTLYKRGKNGSIEPYDNSDQVDFFVISTRSDNNFGQFVFPKSVLFEKNIFSSNRTGGKRGIRVYSPWDKPLNKQAKKTQEWQLRYFLEISINKHVDCTQAHKLYSKKD